MSGGGGDPALGALLGALFGHPIVVREAPGRRLQFGQPTQDPMADVWMIGGVFLERYVTIFDFDGGQIGFAEPAGGPISLRPTTLDAVLPAAVVATSRPIADILAWGGLVIFAVGIAALVGIARRTPPCSRTAQHEEFEPQQRIFAMAPGEDCDASPDAKGGEMPLLSGTAV